MRYARLAVLLALLAGALSPAALGGWKGFKPSLASHIYETRELKALLGLKEAPRFVAEKIRGAARYMSAGSYMTERGYLRLAIYGTDSDSQAEEIFKEAYAPAAHSVALEGIGRKCVAIIMKEPPEAGREDKGGRKAKGSSDGGAAPTGRDPDKEQSIVFLNDNYPIVGLLTIHERLGTLQHLVLLAKSANWRINKL